MLDKIKINKFVIGGAVAGFAATVNKDFSFTKRTLIIIGFAIAGFILYKAILFVKERIKNNKF